MRRLCARAVAVVALTAGRKRLESSCRGYGQGWLEPWKDSPVSQAPGSPDEVLDALNALTSALDAATVDHQAMADEAIRMRRHRPWRGSWLSTPAAPRRAQPGVVVDPGVVEPRCGYRPRSDQLGPCPSSGRVDRQRDRRSVRRQSPTGVRTAGPDRHRRRLGPTSAETSPGRRGAPIQPPICPWPSDGRVDAHPGYHPPTAAGAGSLTGTRGGTGACDERRFAEVSGLPVVPGMPAGSSWGLWGEGDRYGTLNLLDGAAALRGTAAVRRGASFSLNLEMELPTRPCTGGPPWFTSSTAPAWPWTTRSPT